MRLRDSGDAQGYRRFCNDELAGIGVLTTLIKAQLRSEDRTAAA
jgi:hypothetical protein